MKLEGGSIGGAHLELDFSSDAGSRTITLADIAELGGGLAIGPGAVSLRGAALASLTLAGAHWTTESLTMAAGTPARATGVSVDIDIAKGAARAAGAPALTGSGHIDTLVAGRITIESRGRRFTFGLELEGVDYQGGDDGSTRLTIGRAVARELQAPLGAAIARCPQLELRQLQLTVSDRGVELAIGSASASSVHVSGARFELAATALDLPGGLRASRGGIELAAAQVALLEVSVDPLLAPRAPAHDDAPAGDDAPAPDKKPLPIDLRVLDQLSGQVDVDLGVDLTVPVIGRRKATHRFRVAVSNGTLDFKELENDLSSLEDAFIDFEVDDDKLILERRIPLIPGTGKPILIWDLEEAVELELARNKRVRLRRLHRFRVPAGKKKKPQTDSDAPPSVELRQLAARKVDVTLSMSPSQAAVALDGASHDLDGWLERASLGELRVTGAVEHDPGSEPRPGALSMSGRELELGLAAVPLGRVDLERVGIAVERIESVTLAFRGLRPARLEARLAGVALAEASVKMG